jgi:hypothetical protein
VSQNFVPVAVNLYRIREAKDEAGDFFRAARRQKNQYQGIWIVSPDGKVLAAHEKYKEVKTWPDEVLATINTALAAAGDLSVRHPEPRDIAPYWGKGVAPDGTVTLACQMRYFFRGKGIGQGAIDAAPFGANDWRAFAPPEATAGKTWTLPGKVASEFSRCLSFASDQSTMPKPNEVTEVEITGSVERVKGGRATLSFKGHIATLHTQPFTKAVTKARAKLSGVAEYDTTKKEMVSLLWVFEGASQSVQPPARDASPLAAVVDWRREAQK